MPHETAAPTITKNNAYFIFCFMTYFKQYQKLLHQSIPHLKLAMRQQQRSHLIAVAQGPAQDSSCHLTHA